MSHKVIIPKQVAKSFTKIPKGEKELLFSKLLLMEENPFLIGCRKLKVYVSQYRIRVGDYRIRYFINKKNNELVILDVAHRKDIYKNK